MSHFDVVAGTDDVVYGQTGAMNLASTDPNRAITNADSHEYFAENTEAFFGRNDFFPYTRADLRAHDPRMEALLAKLWGVTASR